MAKKADARTTDQKIFDDLDRKHPDYVAERDNWNLYRDVLGEQEIDKEDYLPRGNQENTPLYQFRLKLAEFIPDSPLAIDKIAAALFREKPKRELKDPRLEKFCDDVDLEGTHLNTYMDKVARQILGFGTTRVLVNTRSPQVPVETRAEEIEADVRPYLLMYSPLCVTDWQFDRYGKLVFVRIKETEWRHDEPPYFHSKVTRFIDYMPEGFTWREFMERAGKQQLVDQGDRLTQLGVVPLVVRHWKKLRDMVGSSYIRYSARADVGKFRAESDLAYDTYLHAHPTLKARVRDELSAIGIGSNTYLKLDPEGNEDVAYVDPPTSAFDALQRVIDEKTQTIFRHAGVDPLGVMNAGSSIFQASGTARAWSFGTSEARILTRLADILEDVERQIFTLVLAFLEPDGSSAREFKGEIQYPDEFDLSATQTLLEESQQLAQTVNSPTLLRVLHKRIAASKVGDTTAKVLRTIQKEIDENELIGVPQAGSPMEAPQISEEDLVAAEVEAALAQEEEEATPEEDGSREEEEQAVPPKPKRKRRRRKQMKPQEAA